MGMYRRKDDTKGPSFNSINQPFHISIDDLRAEPDAAKLVTLRALDAAASLLTAWDQSKDLIEPVEGE